MFYENPWDYSFGNKLFFKSLFVNLVIKEKLILIFLKDNIFMKEIYNLLVSLWTFILFSVFLVTNYYEKLIL